MGNGGFLGSLRGFFEDFSLLEVVFALIAAALTVGLLVLIGFGKA